jgi:hypothetical protein
MVELALFASQKPDGPSESVLDHVLVWDGMDCA